MKPKPTPVIEYTKVMVGPYLGYYGIAEYDPETKQFNGRVSGITDVVTFVTDDINQIGAEMKISVDVYLKFSAEHGHKPDKPRSGKFMLRISPSLHEKVVSLSESQGVSLNSYVETCLERAVLNQMPRTMSAHSGGGKKVSRSRK